MLNFTNQSSRQTTVNHSGIGYGNRHEHSLGMAAERSVERYGSHHARCRKLSRCFDRHSDIHMSYSLVVDYRSDTGRSFRSQIPHDR